MTEEEGQKKTKTEQTNNMNKRGGEKQKLNIKNCRLKKVQEGRQQGRGLEYDVERVRQTVNKHTPCLRFRRDLS